MPSLSTLSPRQEVSLSKSRTGRTGIYGLPNRLAIELGSSTRRRTRSRTSPSRPACPCRRTSQPGRVVSFGSRSRGAGKLASINPTTHVIAEFPITCGANQPFSLATGSGRKRVVYFVRDQHNPELRSDDRHLFAVFNSDRTCGGHEQSPPDRMATSTLPNSAAIRSVSSILQPGGSPRT